MHTSHDITMQMLISSVYASPVLVSKEVSYRDTTPLDQVLMNFSTEPPLLSLQWAANLHPRCLPSLIIPIPNGDGAGLIVFQPPP